MTGWDNAGETSRFSFDKEKGRAILHAHIERTRGTVHGENIESRPAPLLPKIMRWLAAACIIAFIGGIWYFNSTNGTDAVELIEIAGTKGAENRQFTLEDGSVVYLNGNTRLRYPKTFGSRERKIYLEGDAFFIIKEDARRPFTVVANNISTHVLGTSFRIRSGRNIEVMVASGKVAVRKDTALLSLLTPGEGIAYDTATHRTEKRYYKQAEISGIAERVLCFNNTPFGEVATELQKWYGVKVIIQKQHIKESIISGEFKNAALKDVLESMALSSEISFVQRGDSVYLTDALHHQPSIKQIK